LLRRFFETSLKNENSFPHFIYSSNARALRNDIENSLDNCVGKFDTLSITNALGNCVGKFDTLSITNALGNCVGKLDALSIANSYGNGVC
jgi:hypothetical protein